MKKILLAIVIFCFVMTAKGQSTDLPMNAAGDSIDIHALVQKQMDEARKKQSTSVGNLASNVESQRTFTVELAETKKTFVGSLWVTFEQIPLTYKVYAALSFLIMFVISARRHIASVNRKSVKELKDKIGMMREEKIGSSKEDVKYVKSRKELRSTAEAFSVSEAQLSKAARKMNLSKGELILAARLRFFESKKMQEA